MGNPGLPLRAEIGRQLRRRRTVGIFVVLTLLPLVLVGAFALGSDGPGQGRNFVDLAQESGANLTVFALFAATGFLFVVVVALFAGDTVPAEATWSSLRYLLAAPVRRGRLLRQKLIVAALSSIVALGFFPLWSLLVGGVAYGWGPFVGPTGEQLALTDFLLRLPVIIGLPAPLPVRGGRHRLPLGRGDRRSPGGGRRGGAGDDRLRHPGRHRALGELRQGLPGHYAFAWADALSPTVNYSDMATGALWSVGYAIVAIGAAVWHFVGKDITS